MVDSSPKLGDVVRRFAPQLCKQRGKAVTFAQRVVLSMLANCGTAALGGHAYQCDHCGTEHLAYNSCRSRHCPSCLGHKSSQWLEARVDDLLPTFYFHVVFTLPQQIAAIALGNKKLLYGILFQAVSQTLLKVSSNPKNLGAQIGFIAVLHTWTQTLLHHPHVHCIVPGGGPSPDGERWISSRPNFFLSVDVLSEVFRGKFIDLMSQARARGELRLAGSLAQLDDSTNWAIFIDEMRKKDWVVFAKAPFESPELVLKYLARYTHRVAISNSRIVSMTEESVSFRYRDRIRGNVTRTMTLSGVEFLRRFVLHVLPKRFVRIRHFGFLANRCRKTKLAHCRALLGGKTVSAPPPAEVGQDDAPPQIKANELCPTCRIGHLRQARKLRSKPTNQKWAHAPLPWDTS